MVNIPDMTTVFHAWPHDRFIDTEQPQEKETSKNKSMLQFSWSQF